MNSIYSSPARSVARSRPGNTVSSVHLTNLVSPCQRPHSLTLRVQKSLPSEGGGNLPPVSDGTCELTGRTWTVTKGLDCSLNITAVTQVSPISYGGGSHIIDVHQLVDEGDPAAQKYVGPTQFDLVTREY